VFSSDTRVVKASGPIDAVVMGLKDTKSRMTEVLLNIPGMLFAASTSTTSAGPSRSRGERSDRGMPIGRVRFLHGADQHQSSRFVNFLPIPISTAAHGVPRSNGFGRSRIGDGAHLGDVRRPRDDPLLMIFVFTIDINRFVFDW